MSSLRFLLPADLTGSALQELQRASIIGGQDGMPFLTKVELQPGELRTTRHEDESGSVQVPWLIDQAGMLMTSTATLIERDFAYPLELELARGKVNQIRHQLADWQMRGLQVSESLGAAVRTATLTFGRAMACSPSPDSTKLAQTAIQQAYAAGEQLVNVYVEQVFQFRHQRQPRLETMLACRLDTAITAESEAKAVMEAFNTVCLPLSMGNVQATEKDFQWEAHDQLLDWAVTNGLRVIGGPLIDFTPSRLPAWLGQQNKHVATMANSLCDYVDLVVDRYRSRIRTWLLTTASNSSNLYGLKEEELLWLTVRIAEAAQHCDPHAELLIGVAQPWGEYLATESRTHSPFAFADTLVRSGLNLGGLNLEVVMGVWPRGSYCRDVLEIYRLIDLYAQLGVPLHITLGLPSDSSADPQASAELAVNAGHWHAGFTPQTQAEWIDAVGRLLLCIPAVRTVQWVHLSDAGSHQFPGCGLIDGKGNAKPALKKFAHLRAEHLR